jgi:hypothetical protein
MAITHNPGSSSVFRTTPPENLQLVAGSCGILEMFGIETGPGGMDISPEEYRELRVFDEFLANHVQPNKIYNVQCMMLWTEWVRVFRRQTHTFPKLVLEQEFKDSVTNRFGVKVSYDAMRGSVYPGLRFIA